MNKLLKFNSKVKKAEWVTPTVRKITFTVPKEFSFTAGQFVSLGVENSRRSYSIASSPLQQETIELLIKKVEGGKCSPELCSLEPGTEVHIMGPMGKFVLEDTNKEPVFIGTGTGVAPLRSMIRFLLESNHQEKITLLAGFRYENEILCQKEWESLAKQHNNFNYEIILSRPKDSWQGETGHVEKLINKHLAKDFQGDFYLCGLKEMIEETTTLLSDKGIPKERVHFERYT